jgi:hypothetical protein
MAEWRGIYGGFKEYKPCSNESLDMGIFSLLSDLFEQNAYSFCIQEKIAAYLGQFVCASFHGPHHS